MITIHQKSNGNGLVCMTVVATDAIPEGTVWIDIFNPTLEEEKNTEAKLGIEIPTREEVWKNQVLNRFYRENGVSYMTAAIITKVDSPYPQTSSVTFVLAPKFLLTIRYITPTSFSNFAQRLKRNPQKFPTSSHVLEGLLEEMITRVAHNSEVVVGELDQLSHDIFGVDAFDTNHKAKSASQVMKDVLRRLGTCADLNLKINESLHSLSRLLGFFKQVHGDDREIDNGIAMLVTDVYALTQQTQFLSDKITFQLDGALGMINVEQNTIIKIFSIVAVFLMPPTLVTGLYGMNFAHMPELTWSFGYPLAVCLMILSALIPYKFFQRKGWL